MKNKFLLLYAIVVMSGSFAEGQTVADSSNGFPVKALKNVNLSAYTQIRYQKEEAGKLDGIDIRRARIDLKCSTSKNWDYRLQVDFGNTSMKLIDATITYKPSKEFSLMAGQFKIPFSLDNLISSSKLDFVNRSQATETLVARTRDIIGNHNGRDMGVEAFGSLFKINNSSLLDYSAAIFNGQGTSLPDSNINKDIAGRIVLHPMNGLNIGGAVYSGYDYLKAYGGNTVRNRLGGELNYVWKDLVVQGEYIKGRDGTINREGYYGYVGYYFWKQKIQLLAKYDFFDPNTDQDKDAATYYIGGINYFFSGNAKLMLNYEAHKEQGDEIPNDFFLAQLQISF